MPLGDIRKAVKKREKYVKLCDGSIGEIPMEWIERYKHLFDLAADQDGGMRLSKSQIMLLDAAIADAQSVQTDEAFDNRLARLRDFTRIEQKYLTTGFTGDFRQYQKSGYDWLHFLHDYDFGGCLADDMGLGKTVQALVFLHSLRESGHAKTADIVVMPKSRIRHTEDDLAIHLGKSRQIEPSKQGVRVKDGAVRRAYHGPRMNWVGIVLNIWSPCGPPSMAGKPGRIVIDLGDHLKELLLLHKLHRAHRALEDVVAAVFLEPRDSSCIRTPPLTQKQQIHEHPLQVAALFRLPLLNRPINDPQLATHYASPPSSMGSNPANSPTQ